MKDRQPLSTEPYKGVHDYYPADWAQVQAVFAVIRAKLRAHGFEEYQASPLERAELYESKTSEEIVSQQTYTFEDRGDRRVTLRPEMTPTLARMIAGKRRELVFPARWFSIGNRFRYERPQKGRSREFYQADVDIVGLAGARAEGEAVVLAYEILRAFGASDADFRIRINSRALVNAAGAALGLSGEQVTEYLALVDRKDKMTPEAFEEARGAFRRDGTDPLELIEARSNAEVDRVYEEFMGLLEALKARGITNVVFDPTIARGFLYYTGLIFEVFDTNPENPRALLGGGRYDGLVSLFGGEPIPAVGFAIGIETLIDFLRTHNLLPAARPGADLFIGTPNEYDIAAAHALADTLRAKGANVLV
ncbi:MAG TPA: histidine--tRNA ligase, partial [Candidatus Paceibacterota bacterium]